MVTLANFWWNFVGIKAHDVWSTAHTEVPFKLSYFLFLLTLLYGDIFGPHSEFPILWIPM